MSLSLPEIMEKYKTSNVFHSHVLLVKPWGKYSFDRQGMEDFYTKYCEIMSDEKRDLILGVAERPNNELPILVDVDIKIADNGERLIKHGKLYTDQQMEDIILVYQKIIVDIVHNCTDKMLTCVLLEKDPYTINKNGRDYVKNGFHLHFPYIFLSKSDQEIHLIPRVQQKIREMRLFENLGFEDSSDVIDPAACGVAWLMYGSVKNESSKPYLYSRVYNHNLEVIDLEEAFSDYKIYNRDKCIIPVKNNVRKHLPRILSIIPRNRRISHLKEGLESLLKDKIKSQKKIRKIYESKSIRENLAIAKRLIPMLSMNRVSNYTEWMTIGWILYNISDGDSEGFDLWCDFSSRDIEKYDEGICADCWEKMVKKDMTLGSLKHFAKIDNPDAYKEYINEETRKHAEESLKGTQNHNDIAKALFSKYCDEFVCASISNKLWFQFTGHVWEICEEGIELSKRISSEIVKIYSSMAKNIFNELAACDNDIERINLQKKVSVVTKMIGSLKSSPYKRNIMKEAMEVFYDKKFKEKLDMNPFLIAFRNGIYDLKTNTFRDGIPEDYLSKQMPIDFVDYKEEDKSVQQVYDFFEKIFPDKSVRKYFMDTSCNVFVGGNHQKIVLFWTGEGDNGKSVTQEFFEKMLGRLAIKFNTTVVTGKKPPSGAAYADLARAGGGVRWGVFEEPGKGELINIGVLKHLSGNDSFYARDLFEKGKDGREIVPMFKLVFICNSLPKIRYPDKAGWNRIRVVPFESTFCRDNDPAPDTYEEQLRLKRFPMDKSFSRKIPGLLSAFAWVLLNHRKKLGNNPIEEPEKVRIATDIYRRQNDIYKQFTEENIVEEKGKILSLNDLYYQFKDWLKEAMPGHPIIPKIDVGEYFKRLWGEFDHGKSWEGFRIRTIQDDVKSGNIILVESEDESEIEIFCNKESVSEDKKPESKRSRKRFCEKSKRIVNPLLDEIRDQNILK